MKIEIEYEASWRNSFLDGSNNEALPKNGRKYIASSTNLGKSENYIKRDVTLSTVMGILNRLIGDQRKLYQAKNDENYYFKDIEKFITFFDIPKAENSEIVYLRNMSGNFDKKSFAGAVDIEHKLFTSDFSYHLWSVLDFSLKDLIQFIISKKYYLFLNQEEVNPLLFEDKISSWKDIDISKLEEENISKDDIVSMIDYLNNDIEVNAALSSRFPRLNKGFSDIEYQKNGKLVTRALYCSSLYLQAIRLSEVYDMHNLYLKGFSVNGFTPKDFMSLFTGGKKLVYGNPYIAKSFVQGEGQVTSKLTKVNGQLEIILDIDREKAKELEQMIENAGVSSFYLGKKGLAYVTHIDTREVG